MQPKVLILILFISLNLCYSDDLFTSLNALRFKNSGTVTSQDEYAWKEQACLYTEQLNVTKLRWTWASINNFQYLYQRNGTPNACPQSNIEFHTDHPGGDYRNFEMSNTDYNACSKACCDDTQCVAWVFALAPGNFMSCRQGVPCCYLKSLLTPARADPICTSASLYRNLTPPPSGVRSAVPIGGIGAGSFELRADGSIHEWVIENQTPGGAAKKQILSEAVFGIRTSVSGRSFSAMIRTDPPGPNFPGVQQLEYGGAFPVSRLRVLDSRLPISASLFAFSAFSVGDPKTSATPAGIFALNLVNPTTSPVDVSFLFNLPIGIERDMDRPEYTSFKVVPSSSDLQCYGICVQNPDCQTWIFDGQNCELKNAIPLNVYGLGKTSGVKGTWTAGNGRLSVNRPGNFPASGNLTLAPIFTESSQFSFSTSETLDEIWRDFAQDGKLEGFSVNGIHGAAAVATTLAPGENKTLGIVFSWYFPNRDIVDQILGNYYSNIFANSDQVASFVIDGIPSIVSDIQKLHSTFYDNSWPEFLQDSLLNSISHVRSGMWFKDGRWRQWEAYDCNDVDSVHNDFQRQLPYILFFPSLEQNKILAWAKFQLSNGMIEETLAPGCLGSTLKMDVPGGRVMGDVTSAFIIIAYEVYSWTGDMEYLNQIWPQVQKAAQWQIDVSQQHGLPSYMTCTYDILNMQIYQLMTFNGFWHLVSMLACIQLSNLKGDATLAASCNRSFIAGQAALNSQLWNGEYFRAYTVAGDEPLMADAMYAQVWAYTLGLGTAATVDKMKSHLQSELKYNDSPYGLRVLTGKLRHDDSIWMGGSPNWASVNIHMGEDVNMSLSQPQKCLNQWRLVLNDQWNTHGISLGGQPWCTSHYGFHMVEWHIPFALSGQIYFAPTQTLSFSPKVTAPYKLPVLIPNLLGMLSREGNTFTFSIIKGKLMLQRLSVNGNFYPGSVNLSDGQSVSWRTALSSNGF